jgi:pyruvate dehydrogenase E2 component (dihydrolipoamide acetyltransferase)
MATEITIPRLGWTMEEGTFLGWLKQEGEAVREGDALYTLESDKSAQEVESTENGILRIAPDAPAAGALVRVGALLGYIAAEGEQVVFGGTAAAERSEPDALFVVAGENEQPLARPNAAALSGAITISPRAARTAAALGIDWSKIRGTGRTGRIRERDVLAAAAQL